jgi:hypothetical protein
VTVTVAILGAALGYHVKARRSRQAHAARMPQQGHQAFAAAQRQMLFDMLRPVALTNCQLERFGEQHDGGYLMCGNLLGGVRSGYSYGIAGYDKWGCDISTKLNVPVHQYDCFDTTRPACPHGRTVFHAECVGDTTMTVDGRVFDTVANQLARNGDGAERIVLKIDVEGAEWNSFVFLPDETLDRIDQIAVEFHWEQGAPQWAKADKYIHVVSRLKRFFEVGHVHFNNASCAQGLEPFPSYAYEVLFVSKRLAVVDRSRRTRAPHPLDARNDPTSADCQPEAR